RRDWIYVEDHCRALESVILNGKIGEVYNIAGGQEKPNLTLIQMLLKKMGKSEKLISFVKDRPAHDRRYAIDCAKISRELNWQPEYSYEKGMECTVDWYLHNEAWWRNVKSGEYENYYQRMYHNR
ncbi:MAG: GDP-mannose 4,6-dehydratase, partial [Chloroflexi bacterium]|nr:GDP-mannose 4,6-dehydratase [Chloroflexota bacterium]